MTLHEPTGYVIEVYRRQRGVVWCWGWEVIEEFGPDPSALAPLSSTENSGDTITRAGALRKAQRHMRSLIAEHHAGRQMPETHRYRYNLAGVQVGVTNDDETEHIEVREVRAS